MFGTVNCILFRFGNAYPETDEFVVFSRRVPLPLCRDENLVVSTTPFDAPVPCLVSKPNHLLPLLTCHSTITMAFTASTTNPGSPNVTIAPTPYLLRNPLTVRFLVSGSGTWTTELLGFTPSVIRNQERSVVLHEGLFQLVLGILVDVFLVVCDDRLGDGLSNSVDLRDVASTGDADTDVNFGEFVETDD